MAEGDYVGTFDVSAKTSQPVGITNDGSFLYIVDRDNKKVYKYSFAGVYQSEWALTGANDSPQTLCTDGTSIWVDQWVDTTVYRYSMTGTYQDSGDRISENDGCIGFCIISGKFYVNDFRKAKIYKYSDLNWTYDTSWSTGLGVNQGRGLATDGTYLWFIDCGDMKVYKKTQAGADVSNWALHANNTDPRCITYDSGTNQFYVTDATDLLVYIYEGPAAVGTNMKINIGDTWKDVESMKINIGDEWKDVESVKINIGDAWKTVY